MTRLFAFGSNGSGQLGLGHKEDVNSPQACIGIPNNETIRKIVGGGNHSAVLTTSGRLFMAGSSQLGSRQEREWQKETLSSETVVTENKPSDHDWTIYRELYSEHQWHDIACGWAFTILVDVKGNVYGIGSTQFGELGLVDKQKDRTDLLPIAPDLLINIDSVACGWRHCIALDRNGKATNIYAPTLISDIPESVASIACGHLHTLFLGKTTGKVYGCGSNKYGQVTSNTQDTCIYSVVPCNDLFMDGLTLTQSRHLTAGWHHSAVFIKESNKLWMWGRNDHGQLQDELQHVVTATSGSEHTLAILDTGELMAWGWNEHGNCTTDQADVTTPIIISLPSNKVTMLGAGCATSWVVLSLES
ncbi:regulator of chromosome condensation 1/beta-lactamase-inhibitor protein II [Halteromyces radiatus]|uniref:regulator of chromosome condensation 1/beta-lactamase-inhibitor protein II n=1 Tax=Halteromyces radiatus TaxID=101107 RepID=UPI00221E9909|nr:regulator of chromosome condensation 1/beta-lactamase-inhibitor protein II [Halteromyces radiatus]KAI8096534.1 regulator of chromosome condensation 1/beta-lactamase-inhibitor protein II [Halteromyces radiatus]